MCLFFSLGTDPKKHACYDIDVEIDDPIRDSMRAFLSPQNTHELEELDGKILQYIDSINQLKQRMDPDNLQIITESAFLQELFPKDTYQNSTNNQLTPLNGKPFTIYHYNGLPRSNKDKKVRYASAQAVISDYGYGNDTPVSAVAPVQPGF